MSLLTPSLLSRQQLGTSLTERRRPALAAGQVAASQQPHYTPSTLPPEGPPNQPLQNRQRPQPQPRPPRKVTSMKGPWPPRRPRQPLGIRVQGLLQVPETYFLSSFLMVDAISTTRGLVQEIHTPTERKLVFWSEP